MKVGFYTLLYIADFESLRLSRTTVCGEKRILVYLRNCNTLASTLARNGMGELTVLTNNAQYLNGLKQTYDFSFQITEISFSLNVPPDIGFYSAHFKIDAYRYLGMLSSDYSFLLDNDMVCASPMPDCMKRLVERQAAVYYAFPIRDVEKHDVSIMRQIEPNIVSGQWVGGEFIGGTDKFFSRLYSIIISFADRYFQMKDLVFHQGDEMLTSIAIEKMVMENECLLVEGGNIGLSYRYYSIHENRPLTFYKSWFYHLICDKSFLANPEVAVCQNNEAFLTMYERYRCSVVRMKKLYHGVRNFWK